MMSKWLRWILSFLKEIEKAQFFGKVTLTLENGSLVNVKKEESIRLSKELTAMEDSET